MPAESGTFNMSHPARHLIGGVKARPHDQYFFCRLARLKPGARTRHPVVAR
jgi:hypothetical protein